MALFQNSVLKKYRSTQDQNKIETAFGDFSRYFGNPAIRENIRNSKEEQFQEGFLRELFVNILGYTINPEPDFNLTTELKNIKDSKKTDGAILLPSPEGEASGVRSALAVIELKGTDTKDLEKIRDQAFNYKNNQPDCIYVITSNFEKLRFYIHNAVDHQEFNLFQLTRSEFELLWLLLQKDNLLSGIPAKIKEESLQAEAQVTKQLYVDYSTFKQELWQDIVAQNPGENELALYKKSQKLLDRFLFIFFAEDKGLLPPNSINEIITQWDKLIDLDEYRPLFDRFKKYFGYLNTGRVQPGKAEIHAYNGGLFAPDTLLDTVKISDDILKKHCRKLSEYDFDTEVDTNILGHIFEHSLNDIENVRASLEGTAIDKSKTKRKKDGVFYTPKYITKYIVDNTLGRLCGEKKIELGIVDEDFAEGKRGRQKKTIQQLKGKLDAYRAWLLQLTICDPACGSGAFLNQVLEYLIAEHRYLDELESQLFGTPMVLPNVENQILENNIFGVDINEESVEIARLSLWLRTAKKGRKLSSLSSNIKVGNSLIDDPAVAGDLAFNWEKEFPQVFVKGGFDVVVGNPPYVRPREQSIEEKDWLVRNYISAQNQFDLYHLFIEKSEKIRNGEGIVSLILPNAFLANENSKDLRSFIIDNCHIEKIIECGANVFDDASVEVLIYVFDTKSLKSEYWILNDQYFLFNHTFDIESFRSNKNLNFTVTLSIYALICFQKMHNISSPLSEYCDVMSGIKEYQVGKGKPPQTKEDKDLNRFNSSYKKDQTFRKEVRGRHISRYVLDWQDEFVSYGPWIAEPRNPIFFEGERLLMRQIPSRTSLMTCFTSEDYIIDQSAYIIKQSSVKKQNLYSLLGILNSKAVFWYYQNESNEFDTLFPKIKAKEIKSIPIPPMEPKVELLLETNVKIQIQKNLEQENFSKDLLNFLQSKFSITKPSTKLQNWASLDFRGFLGELKKAKVQLSLSEEADWMIYFTEQKQKALALQSEINRIDAEIDRLVYELYGLTEEEIRIVEGGEG
jgi:type I restriction-modification system DNA methylase subunit